VRAVRSEFVQLERDIEGGRECRKQADAIAHVIVSVGDAAVPPCMESSSEHGHLRCHVGLLRRLCRMWLS
jgi:hypothetical protein